MLTRCGVILCLLISTPMYPQVLHRPGEFHGNLVLLPQPDGRNMKLAESFGYTDWENDTLTAPPGFITDGATIPRVAWSIVGGPWDGKYRNAAVVHDVGCDTHQLTWQATHKLFYDAMIDSGVPHFQAITMYFAVRVGGPRWKLVVAQSQPSTNQQIQNHAAQVQSTLAPDQKLKVDRGSRVPGGAPHAPIHTTLYAAKFYAVIPTRDVDPNLLQQFMAKAKERDDSGNPMSTEEVEQQAREYTSSLSIQ